MNRRTITCLLASYLAWTNSVCRAGEGDAIKVQPSFALPDASGKGLQASPCTAYGDGVFLVVWREGWHGKGGNARIHAARVSLEGKLLDTQAIEVAPAKTGVQERPRVAFGGGQFLVVWDDLRNGKNYNVLAARVAPNGKVVDREPIRITSSDHNQVLPDVASDGARFVVVWQGYMPSDSEFHGLAASVASDGKVGDTVETGIRPQPRISWNGKHFLVAGSGNAALFPGSVRVARLDADGKVVDKRPEVATSGPRPTPYSMCAIPNQGWLVITCRSRPDPWGWGGPGAMRATLLGVDARPVDPEKIKEPAGVKDRQANWLDMGSAKNADATWPFGASAAAFDGRHAIVVWQRFHLTGEKFTNFENCDLVAARVDGYRPLDSNGVSVAHEKDDEENPILASNGDGRLLLVYERARSEGKREITARILTTK